MIGMTKDGHPRFAHFAIFVFLLMVVVLGITHSGSRSLPSVQAQLPHPLPDFVFTSDRQLLCPSWTANLRWDIPMLNLIAYGTDSGKTVSISSAADSVPVGLVYESQNKFIWTATRSNVAATNILFGSTVIGGSTHANDKDSMSAVRFTTGGTGGLAYSIYIYIASPISASPNNQYSLAIYSDNGGVPGTLIAQTTNNTLQNVSAWNGGPITAIILPNTTYWLAYNTNAADGTQNNFRYSSSGTPGQFVWKAQAFGSWPATFGAISGSSATVVPTIYLNYSPGTGGSRLLKIDPTSVQVVGSWDYYSRGWKPLVKPSALGVSPGYLYLADYVSFFGQYDYRITKISASDPTEDITNNTEYHINFVYPSTYVSSWAYNPTLDKVYFGVTSADAEWSKGLIQFRASSAPPVQPPVFLYHVGTNATFSFVEPNINPIKLIYHPATPNSIWILNSNGDVWEYRDGVGIVKKITVADMGGFVASDIFGDQDTSATGKIWLIRNTSTNQIMGLDNLSAASGALVNKTMESSLDGDGALAAAHAPIFPHIWVAQPSKLNAAAEGSIGNTPGAVIGFGNLTLPEASNSKAFAVFSPISSTSHPSFWVAYQSPSQVVRKVPMFLGGPITDCSFIITTGAGVVESPAIPDALPGMLPPQQVWPTPYSPGEFGYLSVQATAGVSSLKNYTLSCIGPGGTTEKTIAITSLASCPGGEFPQCSDGKDNDGDGKIDYSSTFGAGDLACSSPSDNSEKKPVCGLNGCERSLGEQGFNVSAPFYCYEDCHPTGFIDF